MTVWGRTEAVWSRRKASCYYDEKTKTVPFIRTWGVIFLCVCKQENFITLSQKPFAKQDVLILMVLPTMHFTTILTELTAFMEFYCFKLFSGRVEENTMLYHN